MTVEMIDVASEKARGWLFDSAFPLWLDAGWDNEFGGFFDKLDQRGVPLPIEKRVRVQARQVYCYAEAGRLGWSGPWREAVSRGIAYLLAAFRKDDGLFRKSVFPDGAPADQVPDLYDQAFVLFALASAYSAMDRPAALQDEALALLDRLCERASHSDGGFLELGTTPLPLRSNPHMHLLEALLAWVDVGGDVRFSVKAREIVSLSTRRFLDPATGAVGEYFDDQWMAAPGETGMLREPGHQFEWAYLFDEADRLLDANHQKASRQLYAFGTRHGIRDGRVIFSTDASGNAVDLSSRLWAQTERLRTSLVLCPVDPGAEQDAHLAAASESFEWTWRHLDVPVPGLWRDRMSASAIAIDEPAPASSFYHLLTGFRPLIDRSAASLAAGHE